MDTIFDLKSRSEDPAERLEAYCHFLQLAERQLAESEARLSRDFENPPLAARWARDCAHWSESVVHWQALIRNARFHCRAA